MRGNVGRRSRESTRRQSRSKDGRGAMVRGRDSAGGAGSRVRAGGCGLPELDLEGEELVEEVGADEVAMDR